MTTISNIRSVPWAQTAVRSKVTPVQDNPVDGVSPSLPQIPAKPTFACSATNSSGLSKNVDRLMKNWGSQVNRADFEQLVATALPGHLPVFTLSTVNFRGQPELRAQCQWLDAQGEEAANWSARIAKQENGSLKFYWGGTWISPQERGKGTLEKLALGNLELMKKLSGHPQDVLEMSAGSGAQTGKLQESEVVGRYLWARMGIFEFQEGQQQMLQQAFAHWLDTQTQLAPALIAQLKQSSQNWNQPQQFAEVDPPFTKVEVTRADGRTRHCSLGKAFLLDPKTPSWSGQCYPNQVNLDHVQHLLAWTSKGTPSDQPPPSKEEVVAGLRKRLENPDLKAISRDSCRQKLAQLTGEIDVESWTRESGLRPEIAREVLQTALANPQEEPMALLQTAFSEALWRQENDFRQRHNLEDADFRQLLIRFDGRYDLMETELARRLAG